MKGARALMRMTSAVGFGFILGFLSARLPPTSKTTGEIFRFTIRCQLAGIVSVVPDT
jgi:hypothetical protein